MSRGFLIIVKLNFRAVEKLLFIIQYYTFGWAYCTRGASYQNKEI